MNRPALNRRAMNRPALAWFVLSALAAAVASPAHAANVRITVNGTVATADAGMGFTVGQTVSFFWEINDYAPATPVGSAGSGTYEWNEERDTEPALYASVGGTGISGTYRRLPDTAPYETMRARDTGQLQVYSEHDEFSAAVNHGIFLTANPDYFVDSIYATPTLAAPGFSGFAIGTTLPNPAEYFAAYAGSYSITGGAMQLDTRNINNTSLRLRASFTPTSVSIAPVPEPATWALTLAALACGGSVIRRRRPARLLANGET